MTGGRYGCPHKSAGGRCYECSTGKPRKLIPGAIVRDSAAADSEPRVFYGPVVPPTPPPNRAWSRLWDSLLAGERE